MADRTGWRANLLLALASLLVTLTVVAVAGEVAVRYRERNRTTPPGSQTTLYYRHARLEHAVARAADYFGWIHTDSMGFRGTPESTAPEPGAIRLMALGASTTFDPFVSGDSATWPARMDAWLHELAPGVPVQVINAGVPGYQVIDNLIRLQTEIHKADPDIILVYQTHNDINHALQLYGRTDAPFDARPDEVPTSTPWSRWLTEHSVLYGKLASRFLAVSFRTGTPREDPGRLGRALAEGESQFARDLNSLVLIARSLGIQVVLADVVHVSGPDPDTPRDPGERAMWQIATPYAEMEFIRDAYAAYSRVIREVAERNHVGFISTAGFGLAGAQWYFDGDAIHFNDAGADRMGEQMARALVNAGVLGVTGVVDRAPQPADRHPVGSRP